jgi:hypothetical protein
LFFTHTHRKIYRYITRKRGIQSVIGNTLGKRQFRLSTKLRSQNPCMDTSIGNMICYRGHTTCQIFLFPSSVVFCLCTCVKLLMACVVFCPCRVVECTHCPPNRPPHSTYYTPIDAVWCKDACWCLVCLNVWISYLLNTLYII